MNVLGLGGNRETNATPAIPARNVGRFRGSGRR